MFDSIKLYKDETVNLESLTADLVGYGYRRQEKTQEQGDFAKRGGIVDIFPSGFDAPVRIELDGNKVNSIKSFNPETFDSIDKHTAVIILPMLLHRYHISSSYSADLPLDSFIDIALGDYVVHIQHGIGLYRGIEKLKTSNGYKDYLRIEYDEGDRLYVPTDQLHLVQRFIGFEKVRPKLYKLGSKQWERVKKQVTRGVEGVATDLLALQAARSALKGFKFSSDTDWQKKLEATFPYKETPDQIKTTAEIKQDMELPKPMDRLLCGDVGYGKTEVALRAAFKAVMDNKQVAILVPTTILAQQHYTTFSRRLVEFPVIIKMLSRFTQGAEQESIVRGLCEGNVDIVIGTHRILSDDVRFKDLGLVIIDEEQRFGVKDKEKLKKLRVLVDVITLTATPIPRTLYISLMGAKDISIINTPPQDRQPVETKIIGYDIRIIRDGILKEIKRRGQVFFVHNRIEDIEKLFRKISSLVPEARIAFAHGRVPDRHLENVMAMFIDGRIDVLVATSIIESGIDIPNANTIFINKADTFGLADLYQLRGRVGRADCKAYVYLIVANGSRLTKEAQGRLDAITRYTELGAGFKIAMEDLKIRGAGNILGNEQHGYIMSVGFDLYCRLLREAVGRLKKK